MQRYLNIYNHFGYENQMEKLIEEANEVKEAVLEYEEVCFNSSTADFTDVEVMLRKREHIVEEVGDLLSLATQIISRYEISKPELDKVMDFKLDRTIQRIKDNYYGGNNE